MKNSNNSIGLLVSGDGIKPTEKTAVFNTYFSSVCEKKVMSYDDDKILLLLTHKAANKFKSAGSNNLLLRVLEEEYSRPQMTIFNKPWNTRILGESQCCANI